MTDAQIEVLRFEIAKLEVHTGDILVVKPAEKLNPEQIRQVGDVLNAMNLGVKTMVLPAEWGISVVREESE